MKWGFRRQKGYVSYSGEGFFQIYLVIIRIMIRGC